MRGLWHRWSLKHRLHQPQGGGTGDVVGPASATANAVPRYNLTTGKLIKDSGVVIDDSNNVSGVVEMEATTIKSNNINRQGGATGILLTDDAGTNVAFNGSNYTGLNNAMVNIDTNGIIGKSSATITASGDLTATQVNVGSSSITAANHVITNIVRANTHNNNTNTAGIQITDTTVGNLILSGSAYDSTQNGKFLKLSNGQIVPDTAAGGDALSSATTTDHSVARYDGTNNKTIQGSAVLLDDTNNRTGLTSIAATTVKSLSHLNDTGDAGLTIGTGAAGKITLSSTAYGGTDAMLSIDATQALQTSTATLTPAGVLSCGAVNVAGDILPTTNNSRSLGSQALEFKDAFFDGHIECQDYLNKGNYGLQWTGTGSSAKAKFTSNYYTGATNNSIATFSGTGVLENPSGLAKVDANGNLDAKNICATGGDIEVVDAGKEFIGETLTVKNSGSGPLKLYSNNNKGITIANSAASTVTLTGDDYNTSHADKFLQITDINGTIAPASVTVGDLVGPASSTDDAVATFNGTTGKLVQNTGLIFSPTGVLSGITTATAGTLKSNTINRANGTTGILIGDDANTQITFNGSTYTGLNNAIVNIDTNGIIGKSAATITGAGNLSATDLRTNTHNNNTNTAGISINDVADGSLTLSGTAYNATHDNKYLKIVGDIIIPDTPAGAGGGSAATITSLKFQHDNNTIVTVGNGHAVKVQDSVTLYFPTFDVATAANNNDIVSNLITLPELIPVGSTLKLQQPIVVAGELALLQLEYVGSTWYFKIHKLSAGVWGTSPQTVEAFKFTYQTANTTSLSGGTYAISTTGPYTPPIIISYTPAIGSTGSSVSADLVIKFNESAQKGTGNITIKRYSDDVTIETIDVTSGLVVLSTDSVTNDTATINPVAVLASNVQYYALIDAGAFEDAGGAPHAGLLLKDDWKYTAGSYDALYLDTTAGAASALSFKKLRTAYASNCCQLRRGNDDDLKLFGFVNDRLDKAAVEAWAVAGAGDGNAYMREWYDQSGNAKN